MQPINKWFQYLLCAIFGISNILYVCFYYSSIEDLKSLAIGWWPLNPWFFNHTLFILFPIFNILLWINRKRIEWIDYSLLYMPFLIWMLFLPFLMLVVLPLARSSDGSWGTYYVQLPSIIMIVSCFYLLRFYFDKMKTNSNFKVWKIVGLLWSAILLTAFGLIAMISYMPLLQFDHK